MRRNAYVESILYCPAFKGTLAHIESATRDGMESLEVVLSSTAYAAMRRKPRRSCVFSDGEMLLSNPDSVLKLHQAHDPFKSQSRV